VAANVVILTMAWHTHEDTRLYSRRPQEPDIETLVYWVQRLEPLINAKRQEEVIVIFCNRTGSEDDIMYTGTSAVLGIIKGEVFVYGLLGRASRELLVVDTSKPPVSKLADTDNAATADAKTEESISEVVVGAVETPGQPVAAISVNEVPSGDQPQEPETLRDGDANPLSPTSPAGPFSPTTSMMPFSPTSPTDALSPTSPVASFSPLAPLEIRWAPMTNGMEAVLEEPASPVRPQMPFGLFPGEQPSIDGAIMGSITPEKLPPLKVPASVPKQLPKLPKLPKLVIPGGSPWRFNKRPSPFTRNVPGGPQPQVLTGKVAMTPITAFDIDSAWESARSPQQQIGTWRFPQSARNPIPVPAYKKEPVVLSNPQPKPSRSLERKYRAVYSPESPKALVYSSSEKPDERKKNAVMKPDVEETDKQPELEGRWKREELEERWRRRDVGETGSSVSELCVEETTELSSAIQSLLISETRSNSAFGTLPISYRPDPPESPCPDRPFSPKSRNVSRNTSRNSFGAPDPLLDERATSLSRGSIPISISPSIFDSQELWRPPSRPAIGSGSGSDLPSISRPGSRVGHRLGSVPRGPRRRSLEGPGNNSRSRSLPGAGVEDPIRPRLRSASIVGKSENGDRRPRSLLRFSISTSSPLKEAPERSFRRPRSQDKRAASSNLGPRNVSRGRQPGARGTSVERSNSVGEKRSEVSRRRSVQNRATSATNTRYETPGPTHPVERIVVVSEAMDPSFLPGGENEIIAIIDSPRISPPKDTKVLREPSRPGWKNPYDITLQPFIAPPLTRALAAGDLVTASSGSPFDNSPGPTTPKFLMTTPEPMILVPTSATSPQGGNSLEGYRFKIQEDLSNGEARDGLARKDRREDLNNGLPDNSTGVRTSW